MKFIIPILFVTLLWFSPSKKSLYLLYEKSSPIDTSYRFKSQKASFVFKMYYNNKLEQRLFLFEKELSERDTLSLHQLKKFNLKTYNWLKSDFVKYYHFRNDPTPRINASGKTRYYNLNNFYKNIYVVKVDSLAKRAIIYKVSQDYLTDYEGFDIPIKDTTTTN